MRAMRYMKYMCSMMKEFFLHPFNHVIGAVDMEGSQKQSHTQELKI